MAWQIGISNAAAQLDNFPTAIDPISVTAVGSVDYIKNGRTITARELRVDTGTRTKRCYVLIPPILKFARPMLGAAWPGSFGPEAGGQGALDLLTGNILGQDAWPEQLTADHNIFMVVIDLPSFGLNSYTPNNPTDPVVDNLHCIAGARQYIEGTILAQSDARFRSLRPEMFCGGLSWGAYMTAFTAAACTDMRWAYVGSCCTSKEHDTRAMFNPPEWAEPYDYDDMLIAATWIDLVRWQFGGDNIGGHGNDYLYAPFQDPDPEEPTVLYTPPPETGMPPRIVPNANYMLANMVANGGGRITTRINQGLDHAIDVPDVKDWFKPFQPNPLKRWRSI